MKVPNVNWRTSLDDAAMKKGMKENEMMEDEDDMMKGHDSMEYSEDYKSMEEGTMMKKKRK